MARGWRYVLATARDMEVLATFKECRDRNLSLDLNKSGSASASVPMREQGSSLITPWSTCLVVQRDDIPLWSGPINTRNIDFNTGIVSFSAVGWFDRLLKLQIQDQTLNFTNTDAGEIVRQLLLKAKEQDPRVPVTVGTIQSTQTRTISYTRGQSIGQAIQDLVELESGFDWSIDPVTRKLNVYVKRMAYRKDCQWVFAYDDKAGKPLPQSNLANVVEDVDSDIVNDIRPIGASGQIIGITDPVSQDQYGVFQEAPALPEVVDPNILTAFGQAEVTFRSEPQSRYTMSPKSSALKKVPRIGKDFDIGDITYLTVRREWVQSIRMPQRIFGATLSIADGTDIETLTNLQTRAN